LRSETETFENFLHTEIFDFRSEAETETETETFKTENETFLRRYLCMYCMFFKATTTMTSSIHALIF